MSDESNTEIIDKEEQLAVNAEDITPLEVTIKKEKKPFDVYDINPDPEYENIDITKAQIEEYENGNIT